VRASNDSSHRTAQGLGNLLVRRKKNLAAVALTSKNARSAWPLLARAGEFLFNHAAVRAAA
jgi:hypothetical protein